MSEVVRFGLQEVVLNLLQVRSGFFTLYSKLFWKVLLFLVRTFVLLDLGGGHYWASSLR